MSTNLLKKLLVGIALTSMVSLHLLAQSSYTQSTYDFHHDGIYYIISKNTKTATVTYGADLHNVYYVEYGAHGSIEWEGYICGGGESFPYGGDIVIPETVTINDIIYRVSSIDANAFTTDGDIYCEGGITINSTSPLKSVIIPNSIKSIGRGAFSGCSGLTSVTIPNSVTSIGGSAFSGCSGLKTVIFHCQAIGNWFSNNSSIKDIIIGDEVTTIGSSAFRNCFGLISVTIPNSVTSIDDSAFSGCSGLTSVTIPNSVASIGSSAFNGCSSLTSVAIPNSVTSIDDSAFSGCSGLTSVTIPNSVASIGSSAFSSCSGLTSVAIPNSVTSIGSSAYNGCSSLTSVTIPNSVTSIGSSAFNGCSGLTSVTIPNSVTSIGNNAFQDCSKLSSVSIGKGIISVGAKAFANCPEIKEVYCYAKDVPTINDDTFEDSYYIKWATLYVPESSVELYKASAWSQFGNIVGVTGGNEGERCEKPVITLLANGKIRVVSATEGATCVTNITASNAEPLSNGEISLNTPLIVYTVTSYATKEGYDDSEVATATFRYEKTEGDMNGDGMLNITDVIHLVNMILGQ